MIERRCPAAPRSGPAHDEHPDTTTKKEGRRGISSWCACECAAAFMGWGGGGGCEEAVRIRDENIRESESIKSGTIFTCFLLLLLLISLSLSRSLIFARCSSLESSSNQCDNQIRATITIITIITIIIIIIIIIVETTSRLVRPAWFEASSLAFVGGGGGNDVM
eukprot:GHVU01010417.1.p1 GENE.GHVU01010417.1~~GHVU01010417.1.p1  ORF type:complete len:164 (-),score=30.20 GHVU01010417.1:2-493(-)